jgi:hypothetical protein
MGPLLFAALFSFFAPAAQPSPEEQRLFAEGMKAFEAGNPREAEKAWKAGYQVGRDAAFLVRIAEAQEKAGAPAEALESYRRYVREAPDAADRAEIEQRINRLAPGSTPAPPAGEAAEVPGTFGGGGDPAAATPGSTPPPGPGAGAPGGRATDQETSLEPRTHDTPSGWNALNITAWISVAVAATLLGAAGFYATSAASKKDDVNRLLFYRDELTGQPLEYSEVAAQFQAAMDDGRRYDRYAKASLIAAGAAAAVATVFFILDETREGRTPGVAVTPIPDRAGGGSLGGVLSSLRWSF